MWRGTLKVVIFVKKCIKCICIKMGHVIPHTHNTIFFNIIFESHFFIR